MLVGCMRRKDFFFFCIPPQSSAIRCNLSTFFIPASLWLVTLSVNMVPSNTGTCSVWTAFYGVGMVAVLVGQLSHQSIYASCSCSDRRDVLLIDQIMLSFMCCLLLIFRNGWPDADDCFFFFFLCARFWILVVRRALLSCAGDLQRQRWILLHGARPCVQLQIKFRSCMAKPSLSVIKMFFVRKTTATLGPWGLPWGVTDAH